MFIFPSPGASRASSRDVAVMEPRGGVGAGEQAQLPSRIAAGNGHGWRGARGRGTTYPPRSGDAGAPPGDTGFPCQELADGEPQGLPEARRALAPKRGLSPRAKGKTNGKPKSAARRRKENAAMERREAPTLFKRECGKTEYGRALSALHPLDFFEGDEEGPAKAGRDDGVPGTAKPRAMTRVYLPSRLAINARRSNT
jgi:hypothetical protein